jgi:hypothetical protein
MQGGKQPGLYFGYVPQLMPFSGPGIECLLRQILRIALRSREAHRKPEERLVVLAHNRFELIG